MQTAAANEQHYEVPTPYYRLVLGPALNQVQQLPV
jgi:cyclopropane fatty-acyl-phospholipid synthase-like methyltransferase